jgi:AAA15 family ATPase/GTPase
MIVNFSIQNFRSIKDKVLLSFEASNSDDLEKYYIINATANNKEQRLLKLGLIYGANASGKTTVIQALDFLRNIVVNPFEKKTDRFDFKPFLFDENTRNENTFFSLEFIQNGSRYLYEVELNGKAVANEKMYFYKPNKALVYSRNTELEKQLTTITFGGKITLNKEQKAYLEANTLWNNTVLGGFLKTNFESFELQEVMSWFKFKLNPIITPKTNLFAQVSTKIEEGEIIKNNIVELLKKADFNIHDIIIKKQVLDIEPILLEAISKYLTVSDNRLSRMKEAGRDEINEIVFQHRFDNSRDYNLSYEDESAGTQRYYQLCGLLDLMIRNELIFPIDELESSLHPDLLKYFLLTFLVNSKNAQLIATTHHRELLMERDIFRNDVIWFTERKDNGSTDLFSLADFDSSVVRNTSSVYNAYKIGKLGARPNLNDYYIELDDGHEQK